MGRCPTVRKEIENFVDDTVGIHVSFGMVIVPYILYIVANREETVIQKTFCFMEQMALCQDIKVQEVLDSTILEQIMKDTINFKSVKDIGE